MQFFFIIEAKQLKADGHKFNFYHLLFTVSLSEGRQYWRISARGKIWDESRRGFPDVWHKIPHSPLVSSHLFKVPYFPAGNDALVWKRLVFHLLHCTDQFFITSSVLRLKKNHILAWTKGFSMHDILRLITSCCAHSVLIYSSLNCCFIVRMCQVNS